jgi:secreted trypsin-like serine protease
MMNRILAALLVALCGLSLCSADLAKVAPRLTGGANTVWGDFPSVVSVDSPYNLHCVGNVIDERHILTAAQCVLNETFHTINPFWVTVVAGDINLAPRSPRREVRNVSAIFVHPSFNPFTLHADLAVLRLDRPFTMPSNTIQPAMRSTRIVPVGTTCRFAGWGSAAAVSYRNVNIFFEVTYILFLMLTESSQSQPSRRQSARHQPNSFELGRLQPRQHAPGICPREYGLCRQHGHIRNGSLSR